MPSIESQTVAAFSDNDVDDVIKAVSKVNISQHDSDDEDTDCSGSDESTDCWGSDEDTDCSGSDENTDCSGIDKNTHGSGIDENTDCSRAGTCDGSPYSLTSKTESTDEIPHKDMNTVSKLDDLIDKKNVQSAN